MRSIAARSTARSGITRAGVMVPSSSSFQLNLHRRRAHKRHLARFRFQKRAIFLQWGKEGGGARSARGRVAPEGGAGGGAGGAAMRRRRINTYRYYWERFQHTNCLIHPDGHARYETVLDDFVDSGRFLGQEASLECHLGTRQVSAASVSDLYP